MSLKWTTAIKTFIFGYFDNSLENVQCTKEEFNKLCWLIWKIRVILLKEETTWKKVAKNGDYGYIKYKDGRLSLHKKCWCWRDFQNNKHIKTG